MSCAHTLGIPASESVLRLRLRRALPSAQVRLVYQGLLLTNTKAVYTIKLTNPYRQCNPGPIIKIPHQIKSLTPTPPNTYETKNNNHPLPNCYSWPWKQTRAHVKTNPATFTPPKPDLYTPLLSWHDR